MSAFDNPIVKKEEEKLKEIDSSLKIGMITGDAEFPSIVGFSIPLKNNGVLIKKLVQKGWKKLYKRKRGNVFYQTMEKVLHYQKYAIYKTEFGLRAVEYYDNMYDLKRNGLNYIKEDSLPVIVNSAGGYTRFDLKYEKNFVEIVKIPEDEYPLTREQMYPKNSDKFKYGWIDRAGNTYTCGFEGHSKSAYYICQELNLSTYNAEHQLEKQGYIKISRPVPYNPDNIDKTEPYFLMRESEVGNYISKKQYEKLCELGFENHPYMTIWLRD